MTEKEVFVMSGANAELVYRKGPCHNYVGLS